MRVRREIRKQDVHNSLNGVRKGKKSAARRVDYNQELMKGLPKGYFLTEQHY